MKLGVLASDTSWYWTDLQRAADPSDQLHLVPFTTLAARLDPEPGLGAEPIRCLTDLDAVLVRTMPPGSLEQVVFRMNALHRLSALGTRVVNPPRCLEIAVDKYLASAELQAAGLPVPCTRVSQNWETAMADFFQLGGDVVLKPIFGSEGRGITRINDEAIAWRVFRTYEQLGHVIYQQEYVPHFGSDLRILILGDRQHGIRRFNPTDWRTNVSRGAQTEALELDDLLRELAWRAAQAVGAPFAGIDILPARDGRLLVLEVNAVPGWRALARTLHLDVASELLAWMRTHLNT